jgi:1,4-dihydroxy-6-naphthoate synthase
MALPDIELFHMPFDEIQPAVASGEIDAGILIHEGQLTYSQDHLICLLDLGKWWKKEKGLPLPLGVDVVRCDLPNEKIVLIQRILKESIQYALDHREDALKYALKFGRGLSDGLADRFVGMYVNHYTVDYGDIGRKAVIKLLEEASRAGFISENCEPIFSDEALQVRKECS